MRRITIAIGGNAISENYEGLDKVCEQIARLSELGYEISITHGNGPQVGRLLLQQEMLSYREPLHVLVAMTQAQIGYRIQDLLQKALRNKKEVFVVLSRVLVRRDDESFLNPKKPIGPLYSEEEAKILIEKKGYVMKKATFGEKIGYRRVVPSPEPIKIIEMELIKKLAEEGIVIACGGGGIPVVINEEGLIEGIEAVIDKDSVSAILATELKSDVLLIATNIDRVKLNFMKENEEEIYSMSVNQAKKYLKEGHFLEGSMKPKILACIKFLENTKGEAIITSTDKILSAIEGNAGTKIYSS